MFKKRKIFGKKKVKIVEKKVKIVQKLKILPIEKNCLVKKSENSSEKVKKKCKIEYQKNNLFKK